MQNSLTVVEKELVEKSFQEVKDFRELGEKITAPIDSIVDETAKIIENDPIMDVSKTLESMNKEMSLVYSEIIDNDSGVMKFFKSLPVVGNVAKYLDAKWDEQSFNVQTINGKITTIFSGFDQAYTSLNTSIDMQDNFLEGIEQNLGKVIDYKEYLDVKLVEFKQNLQENKDDDKTQLFVKSIEFFQTNLVVLIGNLEMAKKRLLVRLDSARKLSLSMNASKPIFKTLLSTAIIEISGQKAIDASMATIEAMSKTIDKMSSTLTDEAIKSNKKAEELTSKPVLSLNTFIENVSKLKNHFEEIEDYRAQVAIEAKKQQEDFDNARKSLSSIKLLNKQQSAELEQILNK
ncbi:hypothetical protein [Arcobacter vandammei]|uniref:hypothetical protein n=1 Tax=Arcobacter vandammei TaxID=2782243 RepID=UPI0018E000D7|nr:hypothetical protein [Arcobacter vandammei]